MANFKNWYLINGDPLYNGGFEKEEFKQYGVPAFDDILRNSPVATEHVKFFNYDRSIMYESEAIIQNKGNNTNNKFYERQMLSRIDELQNVNYVSLYDDSEIYLVTSVPIDVGWYEKSLLNMCNYHLKWMDELGVIHTRPCVNLNATKYTTGETEVQESVIIQNTRREIRLPYDPDTLKLMESKRLILDKGVDEPKVYKITSVDRISYTYSYPQGEYLGGYISIICLQDKYNAQTDNVELMIADYYPEPNIVISVLNSTELLEVNIGESYQLVTKVELNDKDVENPKLTYTSSNKSIIDIDENGLITGVSDGDASVDITYGAFTKVIQIKCVNNAVEKYKFTLDYYTSNILFGESETFKLHLYKGKNEQSTFDYNYEIKDPDNAFTVTKTSMHELSIKANNKMKYIGSVGILKIYNEDLGIQLELELKVVGYM